MIGSEYEGRACRHRSGCKDRKERWGCSLLGEEGLRQNPRYRRKRQKHRQPRQGGYGCIRIVDGEGTMLE
jgi:hypothetical protein